MNIIALKIDSRIKATFADLANTFTLKKYLIAIAMALCVAPVFAQQVTTMGTDFWVGFGQNSDQTTAHSDLHLVVRIVASNATKVTFHYTAGGTSDVFNVQAGQVISVDLTNKTNWLYNNQSGAKTNKTLHITSEQPISVYAFNAFQTSTDATNILPTTNLGTDYYHVGYRPNDGSQFGGVSSSKVDLRDGFVVIATENNTKIYYDNSSSATATLNKGEAYTYYAGNKTTNGNKGIDLTGKHLTADKPVAYFTVTQNAQIPNIMNMPYGAISGDNLYHQIPPVPEWGLHFFVPVETRQGISFIRIVASQNNTYVKFSQAGTTHRYGGTYISSNQRKLNAGEFIELELTSISITGISTSTALGCSIEASLPVGVASFMVSRQFRYGNTPAAATNNPITPEYGDPAMAWIPPIGQTIKSTTIAPFNTSTFSFDEHYAMIVIEEKPNARSQTTMAIGTANPGPLSGGQWYGPVEGYSFYLAKLTNFDNSYYITNPNGMFVIGYGLSKYASYYYTSGSALRNLKPSFYINDIHYQDLIGYSFCGANKFDFKAVANQPLRKTGNSIIWKINGVEDQSARNKVTWTKNNLPTGVDSINVSLTVYPESGGSQTIETKFVNKKYTASEADIDAPIALTCAGNTLDLNSLVSVNAASGITNPKFTWYLTHDGAISLPSATAAITGDTTYWVTVSGDNHCVSPVRKRVDISTAGVGCNSETECYKNGTLLWQETFDNYGNPNDQYSQTPLPEQYPGERTTYLFGKRGNCTGSGPKDCIQTEGVYVLTKSGPNNWAGAGNGVSNGFSDDHTTPNNPSAGRMFLANGKNTPDKVYQQTVDDVCQDMELYFSFWIKGSDAQLRWRIFSSNGGLLATFFPLPLPTTPSFEHAWKLYGFKFKVPAGVNSIYFDVYNNVTAANGNDFAVDDIEVRLCAPKVTSAANDVININDCSFTTLKGSYNAPNSIFGNDLYARWLCNTTDPNNPTAWSPVGETPTHVTNGIIVDHSCTVSASGWYRLAVSKDQTFSQNAYNCQAMSKITRINNSKLRANADDVNAQTVFLCAGSAIDLDLLVSVKAASGIKNPKYKWYTQSSGGSALTSSTVTIAGDTAYFVTVSGDNHCESIVRKRVEILTTGVGCNNETDCYKTGTLLWQETFDNYGNPNDQYSQTPLPPQSTTYIFGKRGNCTGSGPKDCIQTEGVYVLVKSGPDNWAGAGNGITNGFPDDHTSPNNPNVGRMFLANGKNTPDKVYQQTINDVCQDMEFYFSFWVKGSDAQLRWRIFSSSDSLLATFYPSPLPKTPAFEHNWQLNGFRFKVPAGVNSIYFDVYNNVTVANGNDFAVDDVEVRLCAPEVTTGSIPDTVNICTGSAYQLTGSFAGSSVFGSNIIAKWLVNTTDPNDPAGWTPASGDPGQSSNSSVSNHSYNAATSGWYRLAVARNDGAQFTASNYHCQAMSKIIRVNVGACIDLYPAAGESSATLSNDAVDVKLCIVNRGNSAATPPVYVTLYKDDISQGNQLAPAFSVNKQINPGDTVCLTMSIPNINLHMPFVAIISRINDNSGTFPSQPELNIANNTDTLFNPAAQQLMTIDANIDNFAYDNGKYANPVSVLGNEYITYTIRAYNASLYNTTVIITDTLPAYLNFHNHIAASTGSVFSNLPVGNSPVRRELKWIVPNISSHAIAKVSFSATPEQGAVASQPLFENYAWVDIDAPYGKLKMTTDTAYHQGAGVSIVTFSAGLGGWIFNAEPQAVDYKSVARSGVIVVPDSGYRFVGWSHDGYVSMRSAKIAPQEGVMLYDTLTVYGNVELRAVFVPETAVGSVDQNNQTAKTEASAEEKIWAYRDKLHIRTVKPGSIIRIYTADGALHKQQAALSAGEMVIKLPHSIYVVTINNGTGRKVRIGDN